MDCRFVSSGGGIGGTGAPGGNGGNGAGGAAEVLAMITAGVAMLVTVALVVVAPTVVPEKRW